jgi:uncharacterized protein
LSVYFGDTSAVAKRYLPEIGSAWVQSWIDPQAGNLTILSELATIEFVSLLTRRQRENSISTGDFTRLYNDFFLHVSQQYRVIDLNKSIFAQARQLVIKHPLRTLDAIQLASALAAANAIGVPIIFISADQKLLAAAASEGFSVDDPNAHP